MASAPAREDAVHHNYRRRSPSVPRRGRRRHDHELVVQRVVKEVGGSTPFPQLTRTNYEDWCILMRVKLEARGLWDAAEFGDANRQEDRMAVDAILSAIPAEMIRPVGEKKMAKEAWEFIKTMNIGSERARKQTLQRLRRDWELLTFRDGELVDDFAIRLSGMMSSLNLYGERMSTQSAVEKLLRVVPDKYAQIALSIETLLDTAELSIAEVAGRLKAVDDRAAAAPPSSADQPLQASGKLYLTEEQWQARMQERQSGDSTSSGGRNNGRGARRPPRGQKKRGGPVKNKGGACDSTRDVPLDSSRDNRCKNCGFYGHWAKDCRKPRREQAHLAAEDEERPALLMAQASVSLKQSVPASSSCKEEDSSAPAKQSTFALPQIRLDKPCAQAYLDVNDDHHDDSWFLDTGATNHMTGRRDVFAELDCNIVGTVRFGDGSVVDIEGQGTVVFSGNDNEHRALTGVYYIPRLKNNILSVGQLDENGATVEIKDGMLRVWDRNDKLLARIERGCNRLYVMRLDIAQPLCLATQRSNVTWQWHERYGHIHFDALRQLAKNEMVHGLPTLEHADQFCDTCVLTKQRRTPFPSKAKFRAKLALDLVHGDICGPVSPPTPGGKKYFLLLVDDFSRFMWLILQAAKSDAPAAIKRFKAAAERESGRKLKVLRTDYGGEFTSVKFGDYCAAEGIKRHHSAPYSPQQNGVVKWRNQTIVATARSLLKQRGMPAMLWGEAVTTAVFLLNRAPTKALDGKMPYEAWYGKKPAVSFLRTFGCVAFMKKTAPHQAKLDDRSIPVVFIGYENGTKAYRVFDPVSRRVHVTRDLVFDEKRSWDWTKEEEEVHGFRRDGDFIIETTTMVIDAPAPPSPDNRGATHGGTPPPEPPSPPATPAPASPAPAAVEFATPPPDAEDQLDAKHGDTPVRFRRVDNILDVLPGLAVRGLAEEELNMLSAQEPASLAEAEKKDEWQQAMKEEMEAVEENKTWRLTTLPPGHRPIGLRWVYKLKKDAAGNVVRHKARLVAKGYVQRAGVDFDEVFAPVA